MEFGEEEEKGLRFGGLEIERESGVVCEGQRLGEEEAREEEECEWE